MQQTTNQYATTYNAAFYADRDARTRHTAQTVLSHLFGWLPIHSVCDVGCGVGTWLAEAQNLGANRVAGYEGPWAESVDLQVDRGLVEFCDLEKPIRRNARFDLVLSLEVVEHLSPERGEGFVADLCRLGDLVLFSAAIPNQGGKGHINERWQSYWCGLFEDQGFDVVDALRPQIWADGDIPWWYRQNMLLYVRRGSQAAEIMAPTGSAANTILNIVHPDLFANATRKKRPRGLKGAVNRLLHWRK